MLIFFLIILYIYKLLFSNNERDRLLQVNKDQGLSVQDLQALYMSFRFLFIRKQSMIL